MKLDTIFRKNKNLILLAIVFICFGVLFLPFLHVIAASIVTAYFAYPLYKRLNIKLSETFAMIATWLSIFLVIIIPIWIVSWITFYQVKEILHDTKNIKLVDETTLKDNKYFKWAQKYITENEETVQEIEHNIAEQIKKFWQNIVIKVGDFIKGLPFFMIKVIMYIFITTSLILNGIKIKEILRNLAPIDKKTFEIYTEKIKYMTNGIMTWNFIVAGIQALTTTISFMLAGIPYAGIVFMISFVLYIPMIWTVILYIPVTIYLLIQGKYLAALLLFLWNSVAVANIDNVFRWHFVPKEARVDNTLMFISILSWILLFGVMWVLYGPLLAVIWVTSIKLYLELKEKK